MKIINQFRRLQEGSKVALRYKKYPTEVFRTNGTLDYGIEILLSSKKSVNKKYEKFIISTEKRGSKTAVIIQSLVQKEAELELFANLIEYVLFELGKKKGAIVSDIKKFIDDWLHFSRGKAPEISIAKQVGLLGELIIFSELIKEFPESNQFNNWHGPEGGKIDFIFSDKFGLEVKSRIQPFKDWVSISSAEQLDNDLDSQHIAVCDFVSSDSGQTIKEFINHLMIILNDHDKANEMIQKLSKVGYDYFKHYSNLIKVSLFRQTCYDTKDGTFPILVKGADLRIDKIKYDINIRGLAAVEFTETLAKVRSQLEQN
jgi:hypothetical protein